MDIRMEAMTVVSDIHAEVRCEYCGRDVSFSMWEFEGGEDFISEEQMEEAVTERLSDEGWEDDLCPDCVYERDNPEEEEED